MAESIALFIPIIAIICAVGLPVLAVAFVLVKLITSNNKERLELARHGIIPPASAKPAPNKYRSLRNGILCIGIAAGIIIGLLLISCISFAKNVEFLVLCSSCNRCNAAWFISFCRRKEIFYYADKFPENWWRDLYSERSSFPKKTACPASFGNYWKGNGKIISGNISERKKFIKNSCIFFCQDFRIASDLP